MEKFINQLARTHFEADRQAFINFIRRSFPLDGDEITDIYNEVWIDVMDNIRRGRTEKVSNWKSYIFGLGWKRAFKIVTRGVGAERIDLEDNYGAGFQKACLERAKEDTADLELLERIEVVMDELEKMPEKLRKVIFLYYIEAKSTAEIASELGYSGARSVITIKKRGIGILKQKLGVAA